MTDPTQDEAYQADVQDSLYGEGGGGGKGGGGSSPPRVAKEAPNNLESNNVAKIIDLLGEGVIKGPKNGLKSIYFEETPLQNDDGSFNFDGVRVTTRLGTPSQSYIPGFPNVMNEVDVSAQVKYGEPITRTVTNLNANAVYVKIQVPALTEQNRENGDLNGNFVTTNAILEDANGNNRRVIPVSFLGKTVSPYQKQVRIPLTGPGPWTLEVHRGTVDDEGSHSRSETYWTSYTEIIDAKLSYPDSAIVAIEVDAKDFGTRIPRRAYHVEGLIISVPSNYNPETRTYSGIWDGSFKQAYSNNAAWVFYDIATRVRYGAKLKTVDKWALYALGKYCDEMVDDGFGGLEPRFTFNTVIETRREAYKVLDEVASVFRGMVYWASDTVMPVADMPDSIYKRFGPADIEGDFEYSGTALRARHSVVMVKYNDPTNFHKPAVEPVENPRMIQKFGWKQKDVTAFATTSRGQAVRVGKWILDSEEHETDTVSFVAGTEAYDVRPGHIIGVSDPKIAGARLLGRLVATGTTQLELDSVPDEVSGSDWFLEVVMGDYSTYTREIASFNGNVVTLVSALPETPMAGSVWVLKSVDVNPRQFRVLSVNEKDGLKYAISCLEHDPTKYARIEEGIYLEPDSSSLIPTGPVPAPTNLAVRTYKYFSGGAENQAITVSWTASDDRRVKQYVIEAQGPQDVAYRSIYAGPNVTADIRNAEGGQWEFRVRAVTSTDRASAWVMLSVNVSGLLLPLPPTSVEVIAGSLSIQLIPKGGLAGTVYEFWRSNVALETNLIESNAIEVGEGASLSDQNLQLDTLYYYYIRGVNIHGVSDWFPVQASTNANISEVIEALTDQINETHLAQELEERIDLIDGPESLTNSVAARVAAEAQARIAALNAEGEARATAISNEQTQRVEADEALAQDISSLTSVADQNAADILSEQTARADADAALASSIEAVTAATFGPRTFAESFENDVTRWEVYNGTGEVTYVTDTSESAAGGNFMRIGNNSGNDQVVLIHDHLLPFDPEAVYKITVKARRTQGAGTLWLGWAAVLPNGETLVNTFAYDDYFDQHYHAGAGVEPGAIWEVFTGYTSGFGDAGAGTLADPYQVFWDARYLRPLIMANYQDQAGIVEIDSFIVEVMAKDVQTINASVIAEQTARTDADSALASDITALETQVGLDISSAISNEQTARSNADSALASDITSLEAQVATDISAAISNEQTARADADSALASDMTTLQSTLGNDIAAVEQLAQTALDAADDSWKAMYTVKLDVNGYISGFGTTNDGQTSEFIVRADRFSIIRPSATSGETHPFIVSGSSVYINSAYIQNATITNAKIANGAINNAKIGNAAVDTLQLAGQSVTIPAAAFDSTGAPLYPGQWDDTVSVTFNPLGGKVDIHIVIQFDMSTNKIMRGRLLVNGSQVQLWDIVARTHENYDEPQATLAWSGDIGTGNKTIKFQAYNQHTYVGAYYLNAYILARSVLR